MILSRLKKSIVQSKVARRIVLLFLVSAIVPVILTALLSMGTLANMLDEYNEEQLKRESKFYGMTLLNRLKMLENKLHSVVVLLPEKHIDLIRIDHIFNGEVEQILLYDKNHQHYRMHGKAGQIPEVVLNNKKFINNTRPGLVSVRDDDAVRIFMRHNIGQNTDDGYIIAEINQRYLWGTGSDISHYMSVCITEKNRFFLKCSGEDIVKNIEQLIPTDNENRYFEFSYQDEKYIGTSWNLFLKSSYIAPDWRISIFQNKNTIPSPAKIFLQYYPLVIILSVLIVLFLSLSLIRRNLVPLERLLEGTKRIANREFGKEVVVQSEDEFAELADSFNLMSNKIECQVNALTILTEIDKIILSSPDSEYLYSRVVQFINEFTTCDMCSIILSSDGDGNIHNEFIAFGDKFYSEKNAYTSNVKQEFDRLQFQDDCLMIDLQDARYDFLKNYFLRKIPKILVFPVSYKDEVAAIVVVGINEGVQLNENEIGFLKEVSTRLAVAIATEERDKELYYHSHYDVLTNLPNRYFLTQRLEQQISYARRSGNQLAVLFIDLDRFKNINDSLGHSFGDKLLISAAERLSDCVRETDVVCRLGGDEFTVILSDVTDRTKVSTIADKIISEMGRTFYVDNQELYVSSSIGISIYPDDGLTCEELLKNADTAMYRAKENGRGHHQYYMEYMNREEIERTNLERELRNAITEKQFVLYYQPLVNIRTGQVTGVETLLRWQHPVHGVISAAEFIPLAEETGLIDKIGMWVMQEACQQYMSWAQQGIKLDYICVNVSSRQFTSGEFRNSVAQILRSTGMSGRNLELEITENLLMDDWCDAKNILDELNELGINFSIDDFGTGYSSLSYLKRFPVDTLKIDQGFLRDVPVSDDACTIVKTIVIMAHTLKMKVIAEGVENSEQLAFLESIECDFGQGYYYQSPLTFDAFIDFYGKHELKSKLHTIK